ACHRRALALAPDFPDGWLNLGHAVQAEGRFAEAERHADRAIRLDPGRPNARVNRALMRLARGDLEQGWADYAQRFAAGEAAPDRRFRVPEWRGEPIVGKRLLVWAEQGLGDELMFGTVIADLQATRAWVTVECDARLVRLFTRALPWANVRAETPNQNDADPDDADLHIPMGSLPRLLRRGLADFPPRPFTLYPDPALAAEWRRRLAALGPGLTVGICWRSSRITAERAGAYTRLDRWGPLLTLPGVHAVNLQYDDCAVELAEAEGRFGVPVHRWPDLDLRNDLDGVAALMAGLDLVVSAPTAVGELAAALGTPVWRLGGAGDWSRLGTTCRPWFPAMRLIAPPAGGGADDAVDLAAQALRACIAGADQRH
ncbi:MAG TPA: N-acetylglucosaminyltransferase, partial [Azospirillum sp.]